MLAPLEVKKVLQSSKPIKTAVELAVGGHITGLRGVYWRIMLGQLPTGSSRSGDDFEERTLTYWRERTETLREQYTKSRDARLKVKVASGQVKVIASKFGDTSSDDDDAIDNPLSNAPTSTYAQSFAISKLESTIDRDMERLWSEDEFFEDPAVINQIKAILLLYCEEEKVVGYRQGRNELASFVVYNMYADSRLVMESAAKEIKDYASIQSTLNYVCAIDSIEADGYWIFRTLMGDGIGLGSWYETSEHKASPAASPTGRGPRSDDSEITFVANLVQNTMLPRFDDELSRHLKKLEVQATAYGIRWLRLVFLREFSLNQCGKIWDALIAEYCYVRVMDGAKYDLNNSLVLHVAVAMLEYVRTELLESDFSYALRRLMRYPPTDDVVPLIHRALLRKYKGAPFAAMVAPQTSPPPQVAHPLDPVSQSTNSPTTASPITPAPVRNTRLTQPPPSLFPAGSIGSSSMQLTALRENQARLGIVLSTVVDSFEGHWFPAEGERTPEEIRQQEERYVLGIAELKKVRDILLGRVEN